MPLPTDPELRRAMVAVSHASRRLNTATDAYENYITQADKLKSVRDTCQAELDAARDTFARIKRRKTDGARPARDRDTLEDWNA